MKSGQKEPVGYQFLRCHGIWDVKLDSFKRKFRLVAGYRLMEATALITYDIVVSKDSVCIALTTTVLHDLEVKAADIMNAHICAPNAENNWTVLGPKFREYSDKKALIVWTPYGQNSSGASF